MPPWFAFLLLAALLVMITLFAASRRWRVTSWLFGFLAAISLSLSAFDIFVVP